MRGSKFFLKTASKLGVTNAFGIIGGEAQALSFNDVSEISFYLTRHEFTAGVMADVYGRIAGKPQICYSTFGPGLTNLATGVFSAIQDRSPVLVVSAQIDRSEICFNQTHQCLDNVGFMKPITKFAAEIKNLEDIPNLLHHAISIAISEIPGPVYISFPLDLMKSEIDDVVAKNLIDELVVPTKQIAQEYNETELNFILKKISNAQNPILIVGNQVIREGECEKLKNFVKLTQIPILSTLASKGAIEENDDYFITTCNKYIDKI